MNGAARRARSRRTGRAMDRSASFHAASVSSSAWLCADTTARVTTPVRSAIHPGAGDAPVGHSAHPSHNSQFSLCESLPSYRHMTRLRQGICIWHRNSPGSFQLAGVFSVGPEAIPSGVVTEARHGETDGTASNQSGRVENRSARRRRRSHPRSRACVGAVQSAAVCRSCGRSYPDATIGKAGAALHDIAQVQQKYQGMIDTAPPAQKQTLSAQANAEAVQAIQSHGLSVQEYTSVARTAPTPDRLNGPISIQRGAAASTRMGFSGVTASPVLRLGHRPSLRDVRRRHRCCCGLTHRVFPRVKSSAQAHSPTPAIRRRSNLPSCAPAERPSAR